MEKDYYFVFVQLIRCSFACSNVRQFSVSHFHCGKILSFSSWTKVLSADTYRRHRHRIRSQIWAASTHTHTHPHSHMKISTRDSVANRDRVRADWMCEKQLRVLSRWNSTTKMCWVRVCECVWAWMWILVVGFTLPYLFVVAAVNERRVIFACKFVTAMCPGRQTIHSDFLSRARLHTDTHMHQILAQCFSLDMYDVWEPKRSSGISISRWISRAHNERTLRVNYTNTHHTLSLSLTQ